MATYRVIIDRTEFKQATIDVEADSEDEASEIAPSEASDDDYEVMSANEDVVSVELLDDSGKEFDEEGCEIDKEDDDDCDA